MVSRLSSRNSTMSMNWPRTRSIRPMLVPSASGCAGALYAGGRSDELHRLGRQPGESALEGGLVAGAADLDGAAAERAAAGAHRDRPLGPAGLQEPGSVGAAVLAADHERLAVLPERGAVTLAEVLHEVAVVSFEVGPVDGLALGVDDVVHRGGDLRAGHQGRHLGIAHLFEEV